MQSASRGKGAAHNYSNINNINTHQNRHAHRFSYSIRDGICGRYRDSANAIAIGITHRHELGADASADSATTCAY